MSVLGAPHRAWDPPPASSEPALAQSGPIALGTVWGPWQVELLPDWCMCVTVAEAQVEVRISPSNLLVEYGGNLTLTCSSTCPISDVRLGLETSLTKHQVDQGHSWVLVNISESQSVVQCWIACNGTDKTIASADITTYRKCPCAARPLALGSYQCQEVGSSEEEVEELEEVQRRAARMVSSIGGPSYEERLKTRPIQFRKDVVEVAWGARRVYQILYDKEKVGRDSVLRQSMKERGVTK